MSLDLVICTSAINEILIFYTLPHIVKQGVMSLKLLHEQI